MSYPIRLHNYRTESAGLRDEVVTGLAKTHKELPSKLFYDERGSELFGRICELDDYYPTRTEVQIMHAYGREMAAAVGPKSLLIEYGSGSSEKTMILLDHLEDPVAYVPIDISKERLLDSSLRMSLSYNNLEVLPVCADYEQPFDIPAPTRSPETRLAYFPGSTIGNFHPADARRFLDLMANDAGPGGKLLIGVDLKKDTDILNRAYNDEEGVTADFNLNILHRINDELGTGFDPDKFRHHAYYNEAAGRVEMHLVSLTRQTVEVDGIEFDFAEGESIWTESSYKYAVEEFAELASQAGCELKSAWLDHREWFSVQLYSPRERPKVQ